MDIIKRLQVGRPGIRGSIPCRSKNFFFFETDDTSSAAQEASYPNKIDSLRCKTDH